MKNKLYNAILPDYGGAYLDHLIGRHRALVDANDTNEGINLEGDDIVRCIFNKNRDALTWGDLLTCEIRISKKLDADGVRRELHTIRQKLRYTAGQQAYDEYIKSLPPSTVSMQAQEHELRADLYSVLCQLYWLYASTPVREKRRSELTFQAAAMAIVLLFFVGASLRSAILENHSAIPTYILVIVAGIIGGFVSMQQRLQNASRGGDPIDDLSNLTHGCFTFFLAPISGAFFALILYMTFAADIIEGTIFPNIVTPSLESNTGIPFKEFAEETGAKTGVDFAKLIIWSFIAGFAERFVPDTLNWLIEKKGKGSNTKTTP